MAEHEIQRGAVEFPARLLIAGVSYGVIDECSAPALRSPQPMYSDRERGGRNWLEVLVRKRVSPQNRCRPPLGVLAAEIAISRARILGGVRIPETFVSRRIGPSRQ